MIENPGQLLFLVPGLLSIAYAAYALLRGKVLGREGQWGWHTQIITLEDTLAFPFFASTYLTFGIFFTLIGFDQMTLLTRDYLVFRGSLALVARLVAVWLAAYTIVFFLAQMRQLFR
jgi:hypothetical protein